MQEYNFTKIAFIISLFLCFITGLTSVNFIDQGELGVIKTMGEFSRIAGPGLSLKFPFLQSITIFKTRVEKTELIVTAASSDLQDVTMVVAMQSSLRPDSIQRIYSTYRNGILDTEVYPGMNSISKSVTARFTAEQLVTKRAEVVTEIQKLFEERFSPLGIQVSTVDIVDFKFSPSFTQAIEQKVTAEQNALKEENRLKEVQFIAQQTVESAKAQAEAIKIQAEAINSQGGADYVNLKAVEKWNGILPTHMLPNQTLPIMNI